MSDIIPTLQVITALLTAAGVFVSLLLAILNRKGISETHAIVIKVEKNVNGRLQPVLDQIAKMSSDEAMGKINDAALTAALGLLETAKSTAAELEKRNSGNYSGNSVTITTSTSETRLL